MCSWERCEQIWHSLPTGIPAMQLAGKSHWIPEQAHKLYEEIMHLLSRREELGHPDPEGLIHHLTAITEVPHESAERLIYTATICCITLESGEKGAEPHPMTLKLLDQTSERDELNILSALSIIDTHMLMRSILSVQPLIPWMNPGAYVARYVKDDPAPPSAELIAIARGSGRLMSHALWRGQEWSHPLIPRKVAQVRMNILNQQRGAWQAHQLRILILDEAARTTMKLLQREPRQLPEEVTEYPSSRWQEDLVHELQGVSCDERLREMIREACS